MRRRISHAEEELGIRFVSPEELAQANQIGNEKAESRKRTPIIMGADKHFTLALTGYHFCKACQRIVKPVSDPEIHLVEACEFNPAHTVAGGEVVWNPPV